MTLGDLIADVREKHYPAARNAIAESILQLGGKGTHEDAKEYFHGRGNYQATKALGTVLPPRVAANLVDSAYLGNEAISGTLGMLLGKPFFSEYGFRWRDVPINRRGQDRAIAELEAQAALEAAIRREREASYPAVPIGGKE